jgi:hypothetical protein
MTTEHDKPKAVASLIYWTDAAEKERIERWIKKLQDQGFVQNSTTREYNPDWGCPVWYIP